MENFPFVKYIVLQFCIGHFFSIYLLLKNYLNNFELMTIFYSSKQVIRLDTWMVIDMYLIRLLDFYPRLPRR